MIKFFLPDYPNGIAASGPQGGANNFHLVRERMDFRQKFLTLLSTVYHGIKAGWQMTASCAVARVSRRESKAIHLHRNVDNPIIRFRFQYV